MYKVLIATNDYLMQEAIKIIISKDKKFKVTNVVESSDDAIKMCKNESINIFLIDLQIIGMSVVEASRTIKHLNPEANIYIITHFGTSTLVWPEAKNYVEDIIEKPVTYKRIKNILEEYKTENENTVQVYVNELIEILKRNDFANFYFELPKIIDRIYANTENDAEKLVKIFKYIANKLTDTRNFHDDNIDLIEVFPINETVILDKKISEIWLFKVMDYLFQKNSIDRYSLLENIFSYIVNNIKEKIALTDITDNCAIRHGYLSRIFREQLLVSVMEYLHMKKIHLAKGYFYFTTDSIEEVAFKLGYNESSYFSKVFKKYESKTVKQYKLENGKI